MFSNTAYEALYQYLGLQLHASFIEVITSQRVFAAVILLIFGVMFFIVASTIDIESTITGTEEVTAENFSGLVDVKYNSAARITVSADGASKENFLQGSNGHATSCRWNDRLGCAQRNDGAEMPFAITADSEGKKTYSSTSDTSMCKDLDKNEIVDNTSLSDDQVWDCSLEEGEDWVEVEDPRALEDAGGKSCETLSDVWERDSGKLGCSTSGYTATSLGCYCDNIYSIAVQEVRLSERQFICKAKGIFNLIKDKTLEVEFKKGDTLYLKTTIGRP